ncbi:MAG TPA: hypothetical protein VM011_08180, partial [Gammaproteobacteria bacterium]|nr:hypothetical protein [Gammaproteobacteria bacterium]
MNKQRQPGPDQHHGESIIRGAFYRSLVIILVLAAIAAGVAWYLRQEDETPGPVVEATPTGPVVDDKTGEPRTP